MTYFVQNVILAILQLNLNLFILLDKKKLHEASVCQMHMWLAK